MAAKTKNKKEYKVSFWSVLRGDILREDFLAKNGKVIILALLMIFFLIGNRYTAIQKLREIEKLQKQLTDLKYEHLSISSELTGNSRPSQIEQLVKEQNLDLEGAKTPPYKLHK